MFGAVAKPGFRPDCVEAQRGVPGERAEADDALCSGEQPELTGCVGEAGVALGGGRFVPGRSTADGGGDPESPEA